MPKINNHAAPPTLDTVPGLNYRKGLRNFGGDESAYVLELAFFVESPPRSREELSAALREFGAEMLAINPTPEKLGTFITGVRRVIG